MKILLDIARERAIALQIAHVSSMLLKQVAELNFQGVVIIHDKEIVDAVQVWADNHGLKTSRDEKDRTHMTVQFKD